MRSISVFMNIQYFMKDHAVTGHELPLIADAPFLPREICNPACFALRIRSVRLCHVRLGFFTSVLQECKLPACICMHVHNYIYVHVQ